MKRAVLVLLVAVSGCGAASAPDPLVGTWESQVSATSGLGLSFTADGNYVALVIEVTSASGSAGTANVDTESGSYTAAASSITFTPVKASCPGPIPVYTFGYSFQGAQLFVTGAAGGATFSRNVASGTTTGTVAYGCFSNGMFTPRPIAPVTN